MSESSFGVDPGFDKEETSQSSDVRAGYDDDEPPPLVVEEAGEDEIDSHAADVAAGYDDEDQEDEDTIP
jgi:hypothetical protein